MFVSRERVLQIDCLEGQEGSDESLFGIIVRSQTRVLPEGGCFQEDDVENFELRGTEKVRLVSYFGMVM